jgi:hypothetical protein
VKKIYFFLFASVIGFSLIVKGQSFQWAKQMGGTSSDGANYIVKDAFGNIYTTGTFQGTADFDPGPGIFNLISAGSTDIFISKLDANGNFVWAKQIGGTDQDFADCITVDDAGNIYTTGFFFGTADFDPGPGTYSFTAFGSFSQRDIFVSKLDSSGNFIWAKQMGGANSESGKSVAVDDSGNVYTIGYLMGSGDYDPGPGYYTISTSGLADIFLLKLDSAGNFIWVKKMGSSGWDYGYSICIESSGNICITGSFQATVDFDPGPGTYFFTSAGGDDIFISKLDASGSLVWARQMGGTGYDEGYSISVDNLGNVYSTGEFMDTADFDPGAGIYNLTSAGSWDIYVSKLDAGGNFVWARRMGGTGDDEGWSVSVNDSGNVFTTGFFSSTVDFDPGPNTCTQTSVGGWDIFISRLDSSGNLIWTGSMGDSGNDIGTSVAVNTSGNFYTTGLFAGTVDFDPGGNVYNMTSMGAQDIFVHKMSSACMNPNVQASNITFSNTTLNSTTVHWTNGNGARRIVKIKPINSFTAPVNGNDYTANSVYSGSGEQVVYNGTGNSVTVTGLNSTTLYWFRVYEASCSNTNSLYYTSNVFHNPWKVMMPAYVNPNRPEVDDNTLFSIFPNPTPGNITLETSNDNPIQSVTVYSIDGKLLKSIITHNSEIINVDLQGLNPGIYFLDCKTEGGSEKIKILKY